MGKLKSMWPCIWKIRFCSWCGKNSWSNWDSTLLTSFLPIFSNENSKNLWRPERKFQGAHFECNCRSLSLFVWEIFVKKGKKDVWKEMKLCQVRSPMPPHAAQGQAPRYEGYHRCKERGDQVLTCTCHMCTTNELSACFWVNMLMIAMGGNFF